MNKKFNNNYFFLALAFLSGGTLIWFTKPSNDETIDQTITASYDQAYKNKVFTCSMHPQIRQSEPGNCPICGMELIPLESDSREDTDPMAVRMSPAAIQLAGVSTTVAGDYDATKTIRLNGKVQEDERLVYSQVTHFAGRIEKLSVNFTGEYVTKGSPIAYLYSPQLVTAQQELHEAYKIRERQPHLYRAARRKLSNRKLSEQQIDQLIASGTVKEYFPVLAGQSGYAMTKKVNPGDHVNRGQILYEIANLSRVWVLFDIYESDLSLIRKGDTIRFEVSALPGQKFDGTIDYIDPVINPATRVAKARVVVRNADRLLKPGMFVSGEVNTRFVEAAGRLTVPKTAVMWTGKRSVVYVKQLTDEGVYFRMREVTLGPALGGAYRIEAGLQAGEEIAVNGTFSIDAAAQLAGKPSMMNPEEERGAMAGHDHGKRADEPDGRRVETSGNATEDPEFQSVLSELFSAYMPIKDALTGSDPAQTQQAAYSFLRTADQHIELSASPKIDPLTAAAKKIADSKNLEEARAAFAELSDRLFHALREYRAAVKGYRQYCPMAFDNTGAYWLSLSEEIRNPYFGSRMLRCGRVEEEL